MGLESKVLEEPQISQQINREKTCPLLLRVFCNTTGYHNRPTDYIHSVPGNELQIYTWLDASLSELTRLITEVYPYTKTPGTEFYFAVVWPKPVAVESLWLSQQANSSGKSATYSMKEIGRTTIGIKGEDDNATLLSNRFIIGDYIDVAINIARSGSGDNGNHGSRSGRDDRGSKRRSSPASYDRRRYHDYR